MAATLDEEVKVADGHDSVATVINLNIGGTIFSVSSVTLANVKLVAKDSFFNSLLSTTMLLTRDAAGNIFIDRDATHFRHILNYLRMLGLWHVTDTDLGVGKLKELLVETEFYSLTVMSEQLKLRIAELTRLVEKKIVVVIKSGNFNSGDLSTFLRNNFSLDFQGKDSTEFVLSGPSWNSDLTWIACVLAQRSVYSLVRISPALDPTSIIIPTQFRVRYDGGIFFKI